MIERAGPQNGSLNKFARLAGFMFLFVDVADLFGVVTLSRIRGSGDFAETARRILASEHLFRVALTSLATGWVATVLLAYALYAVLESVNRHLALLALLWRLAESAVGGAIGVLNFAALKLFAAAQALAPGPFQDDQLQTLVSIAGNASVSGFYLATLYFNPASVIFFYLFYKSRYIPRPLALFGLIGSLVAFFMSFAILVFPEQSGTLQFAWLPIGVAEFVTGLWLWIRGIRSAPAPARS